MYSAQDLLLGNNNNFTCCFLFFSRKRVTSSKNNLAMALLAWALKIYFSVFYQFHIEAVIFSQIPAKHKGPKTT
jgi:uncharacterized protein (UPF0332 family)